MRHRVERLYLNSYGRKEEGRKEGRKARRDVQKK